VPSVVARKVDGEILGYCGLVSEDLLGTSTEKVPILLPPWYRELAADPRVGLPEDHPWKDELPDFGAGF
jgi:hypothetical protein